MLNGIWLSSYCGYNGENTGTIPSTSAMSTFGTKVGTRYKAFANVSYFIGGDEQPDITSQVWSVVQSYATALRAAAPAQLITYHPRWYAYSATNNQSWLSYNSFQANDNNISLNQWAQDGYNLSPTRPVFCMEPPYDPNTAMGNTTTPLYNRQNQWGAFLGGTLGVSYGGPQTVWYAGFGGNDNPGTYGPLDYASYDRTCAQETPMVGAIMSRYAWSKLVPNNGVVSNGGSGRGQNYAALAGDGTLLVTYTQGNVTVNTSAMTGTLTGQWYSPTTGQPSGGSLAIAKGSGQYMTCPTGGDGVLVITSA